MNATKEHCALCGQVDVQLVMGKCLDCLGLSSAPAAALSDKAQNQRRVLMHFAKLEDAGGVANCVMAQARAHLGHHMTHTNVATSIMAHVMVANMLLTVAAEWWADVQQDAERPETYAVLRDLINNPPAEFDVHCYNGDDDK